MTKRGEEEKKKSVETSPVCILSCGYIGGFINQCLASTGLRVSVVEVLVSPSLFEFVDF
jgi:hypothetical protein